MKFKRLLLILLLSAFSFKRGFSQLTIQNNLTVPIEVCVGWFQDVGDWNGMESKGWFTLYPGQALSPGIYFTHKDDYFFFYARTTSGDFKEVRTGTRMLIHPKDPFDIKNADLEYVKNENPVYQWKMFKTRDVHFKKHTPWIYTFQITISDIVDAL